MLASAPGSGTATHIGRFRVEQTVCLNLATGVMTDGEATLIAANGDELYGTWNGTPVPGLTLPTWQLSYVITGGTGRFARAEGEEVQLLVKPTEGMKRVPLLPLLCAVAVLIAGCVDEQPDDGLLLGPSIQVQAAVVPNPAVTGPIPATAPPGSPSHDSPFFAAAFDLAAAGYVEEEFFIEGTAHRYTLPDLATGTMLDDGHPYRTRMIVRRPASASDFNGTVVMEWQNAVVGHDFDGLWLAGAGHFMRRGYALVAVSVQWWGVQLPGLGLRAWSPGRYGTLDVTDGGTILDDALAFDIFSQAAQAIRRPQGTDPLGGLGVKRIIAAGISQGAGQLARYHNSLQPLTGMFDAPRGTSWAGSSASRPAGSWTRPG